MNTSTPRIFSLLLITLIALAAETTQAQNVLNPNDTIVTFVPADTPRIPAPPVPSYDNTIHKWLRTADMSWNTSQYKCYIYNGNQFRLCYPLSYNPTANDGKKYPMLIFDHGEGEAGSVYDNEQSLYHGGQIFSNAVAAGTFDGYILVMQTSGGFGPQQWAAQRAIIDYMVTNNKLDPFRVTGNGLSGGGAGTWGFFTTNPTYEAAILPMSADAIQLTATDTINLAKYTPIWNIHGGLDGSPAPATAAQVYAAFSAAGANYVDLDMTTQGHDTWDSTWSMPAFWPFMLNCYCSNPWTLFGQTQFCPGVAVNVTIGLAPGFQAYQWEMNGTLMSGATSNTIHVTQYGTYSARVERNGNWSNWSPIPVVISVKTPTVTPPISVAGLMSDVLPGADGKTSVTLQVPDSNYTSFTWEEVGSSTVVSTQQTFTAKSPGQYIVSVTQQHGCSSNFSPPFTVINANGPNPPSPAANLVATALSFTQVQLIWARNPHPTSVETGFEIYRSTTSGGPWTFIGQVPTDTVDFMDHGLTPKTTYYYVVRTIDSTAAAALSNQATVTTGADKVPPTAPTNLQVVTTSSSSVSLLWNSATDNVGVTGYYVYINGAKSFATGAGDTTFQVSDLTPNTEYSFFVVAVDGSGNASVHSNQVSAPTINSGLNYSYYNLSSQPSVMPNFSTLTPTFSGNMPNVSIANATAIINFSYLWNGYITIPVTGNYVFQTVSDDGSQVWLGGLNQTAFPYSFTGTPIVNANQPQGATATNSATLTLQAGTYPISIAYFQAGGGYSMVLNWKTPSSGGAFVAIPNSAFAGSFTPAGTVPAIPTQVKVTATAYNKINITWTDNSNNETGFEVYRASSSTGTYSIVTTTGANVVSFTDSTVQAATTYFYKVQAINLYGGSGFDPASIGGITYSYYNNFTANNLASLPTLTPTSTGSLPNISLSPATQTTDFAFKFQGTINIPTTGSYTFYTSSDDGSDMYLGGFDSAHLIVKNDFLQGQTQRASAPINLTAGSYPLYVTYFQQGGGYVVTASYQGPGISMQAIPNAAFVNTNSFATTFALPAAPSAPYSVAATALSPSKVKITWQDSSATVTGYQVYRSISDTVHYISFATVAAGTLTFTDSALFSNEAYYYKVVAVGVSGNSAYSPTVTATTPDVLPVITMLPANEQARYGTTTVIPVSATSVNSGTLAFTALNLPSFASFVDNGNRTATLTLNPVASQAGTYTGLYIVVTDAFGGTDTTKFSLAVNNNYPPVLDSVVNYTINEGDTLTIPLVATNQNPSDTLNLSAKGLPAGYTVTAVSNGVANLFVHPNYAAAGVYTGQVTVNDNNGLSATRTFVLTVKYKNPNQKIFTRVSNSDAGALGLPWNALQGTTTNNLLDSTGNTTTVGLSFSPSTWWNTSNDGSSTGNNSGVYPDVVLLDYMWFGAYYGGPNTIGGTVTGLDTTQTYTLTFFSNSTYSGVTNNGTTTYTVGSQTVSLAVQNNQHNTASITGIKPASGGVIPFTLGLGSNTVLGYINAIVITKQYNDGTAPAGISGLTALNVPGKVQLSWTDSAYNATDYEVWRAPASNGIYTLQGTAAGNSANSYIDSSITGNTAYIYKVRAANSNGYSAFDSVSTTTLNRVPKITAIANITMVDTQSVTVNVTTTDDSTATLTLTASNLPPFASFTDNGNGTGVLTFTPTAGTVGVYPNVTVTVADELDSTASTSFVLAVTEPNVQSVYLNFTGGATSPLPWNSLTTPPFAGTVMSNLVDASNNPTTISATLVQGFYWFGTTGWVTGNSDPIYPTPVTQNFFYDPSTATRQIQISGLNDAKQYNFVFFNSQWDGTNGMTDFTINGQTDSLQADWNINKTVQINGIVPVNGVVTIGVSKASEAANLYINSIVIQGYDTTTGLLLNPTGLISTRLTQTTVSLRWQDRSAIETGYQVWRASDSTGAYALIATLPANAVTYQDTKLSRGTNYYYIVRAVSNGNYSNYSNVLAVTTYSDAIYIAVNSSNAAPSPWNNLDNPGSLGASWSNFIDSTTAPTSVSMVQTGLFAGPNSLGDVTGNNSGVYPDAVLLYQYVLFPGNVGAFQLSGLDLAKKYDLTFLGSESYEAGNNNTAYIVNGDTVFLNALDNTSATVTMRGLIPNGLGQLNISMISYGPSLAGWFNAMVIDGYLPLSQNAPTPPQVLGGANTSGLWASPAAIAGAAVNTDSVVNADTVVNAYPNPFHTSFTLSVPADYSNQRVLVGIYDVRGVAVYRQEFDNLVQGENYFLINAAQNFATTGIYFVKVMYEGGKVRTFKLLKQ